MRIGRARTYLGVSVLACVTFGGLGATPADEKPVVVLDTTAGAITIELDPAKAPITVENFLTHVDALFYNNLIFHRVIPGFMIQGGGLDIDLTEHQKKGAKSIKNESDNGLSNKRGTITMARMDDPDSATSQFFINVADNKRLDGRGGPNGYTVFGKVLDGMDVVDAIVKAPRGKARDPRGMVYDDVPVAPIVIKSAKRKAKS